ncbi:unnamed protein product [Symbiodinium sp. CCMP2592]|nr:unnamed protein product [Symbiodinium sp. CCMP2592]
MLRLPVVALSIVGLVRAGPDWLESEQHILLQQRQNHSNPKAVSAQDIIDKHFAGIPNGGSYVRSNLIDLDGFGLGDPTVIRNRKYKTAAWACSTIDFKSFLGTGADNEMVKQIMDHLHLTEYCGLHEGGGSAPTDPTCRAFWAAMKAHLKLQNLGFDPVFKRMAIVNWYVNEPGHFPSWGSGDGVTVKYSGGKFAGVTINDPNAVSGYAFCDIMYTILRQNFDQAGRAQCAPTAVLTAMASTNPAGAMKMGLELFWTGTIKSIPKDEGCPFIYSDAPPGVIPFAENQPGTEGSDGQPLSIGECLGNAGDCKVATGNPFTNAGLQGMWAIRMSARRDFLQSGRSCAEEKRHAYVSYPGMGPHYRQLHDGFSPAQTAGAMQAVFGTQYIRNDVVEANRPSEKTALDKICSSKGGATVSLASSLLFAVLKDERGGRIGMTEENPWRLDGATHRCGDKGYGNDSDHAAYIEKCTGDVVTMWTWTGRLYFTRNAVLLWGMSCHKRYLAIESFRLVPEPRGVLR